jgi:hypothetical protein
MIATGAATSALGLDPEALSLRYGRQSGAGGSSTSGQDQPRRFDAVLANLNDQQPAPAAELKRPTLPAAAPNPSVGLEAGPSGFDALLANLADQKPAAAAGQTAAKGGAPGGAEAEDGSGMGAVSTDLAALLAHLTDQKTSAAPVRQEASGTPATPDTPPADASVAPKGAEGFTGSKAATPGFVALLAQTLSQTLAGPPAAAKLSGPTSLALQGSSGSRPQNKSRLLTDVQSDGLAPQPQAGSGSPALSPSVMPDLPVPGLPLPTPASGAPVPVPASAPVPLPAPNATSKAPALGAAVPPDPAPPLARGGAAARQSRILERPASKGDDTTGAMPAAKTDVPMVPPVAPQNSVPRFETASNLAPPTGLGSPVAVPSVPQKPTAAPDVTARATAPLEPPAVTVLTQETHFAPAPTLPPMQQIIDVVQTLSNASRTSAADRAPASVGVATTPISTRSATQILTIQLEPEHLGSVVVKMRLSANSIELHVDASNATTASLLSKEKSFLSDSLQASNYKVDGITIGNSSLAQSDLQGKSNDPHPQGQSASPGMGLASSNGGAGSMEQGRGQAGDTPVPKRLDSVPEAADQRAVPGGPSRSSGLFV